MKPSTPMTESDIDAWIAAAPAGTTRSVHRDQDGKLHRYEAWPVGAFGSKPTAPAQPKPLKAVEEGEP